MGNLKGNNKKDIVLIISDTHFNGHHEHAFDFLAQLKNEFKPTRIVHIGDEIEAAGLSEHDHDPDSPSAGHEYKESLLGMKTLYKIFPSMDLCISNHGSRLYRKAFKSGIPYEMVKTYQQVWGAPSTYIWRQRIIIDDVLYIHGDPGSGRNLGFQAIQNYKMSVVHGHVHANGGVQYFNTPVGEKFWLNVGCLINPDHRFFKYAEKWHQRPTLGCGLVVEGVSGHFLRMPL